MIYTTWFDFVVVFQGNYTHAHVSKVSVQTQPEGICFVITLLTNILWGKHTRSHFWPVEFGQQSSTCSKECVLCFWLVVSKCQQKIGWRNIFFGIGWLNHQFGLRFAWQQRDLILVWCSQFVSLKQTCLGTKRVVGFMIRLVFQRWVTMPMTGQSSVGPRGIDLAVQIDIFSCDVQDSRDCQGHPGLQFCTYTGYIDNDFTTVIKCSWALQIKTCFTLGLIYWLVVWNMFFHILGIITPTD
jgi:hypothetical protein